MNGRRKRALVVDSDERMLIAVEHLLEDESVETTTSWSGVEALQILRSGEFDVLLTGDHLPDLSCEQLMREIQRSGVGAAVLVMESGAPRTPSTASYFLSLGATGTVRKWHLGEILERVKALPMVTGKHAASAA
jgi:two-component system, sensor histidine kinase ChiS